ALGCRRVRPPARRGSTPGRGGERRLRPGRGARAVTGRSAHRAAAGRSVAPAPVAVALDTADLATATGWAAATAPYVAAVKVGLELYVSQGPDAVHAVRQAAGRPVFLDLKLHDIPNTVAGAARAVAPLAPA